MASSLVDRPELTFYPLKKRVLDGLMKGTQSTLSTWISPNHRLLLTKLQCYGIAPSVINWIESYLPRRSFQVSVNGSLSQVAEAVSRVPQCSVLGPILFVIYVNDLSDNLTPPENNQNPSKAPCSLAPNGQGIGS